MRKKKPQTKYGTVLLIDDSEIDNFINQKVIESTNFAERVFVYSSGRGALEFIKNIERNNDNIVKSFFPDMMMLDISMPLMDGFQFLKEMETFANSKCKKCKVAILTSSLNPIDQKHSSSYKNIVAFINKPLTVEKLERL